MRGFKAFNKDLCCRGFQYEIGGTYEFDGEPILCQQGFHFCKSIAECYRFCGMSDNTRICVVDAIGDIATDDEVKYCTNKIMIVEEITEEWKRKGNISADNTGYLNTGDCNTGVCNTGNYNTGDRNTGDRNTGYRNTGFRNTGNFNTGNCNIGKKNVGDWNIGNYNTGNYNTGDWNVGDRNVGNCNIGNWNAGDMNIGDWNTGNRNIGVFNKETPLLTFFDKPSDWTYDQWLYSDARRILNNIENDVIEWIFKSDMTDEEKEQNPTYKTTGGYLKVLDEKGKTQIWWNSLSEDEKQVLRDLPNYDEEKFTNILGIRL